MVGIIPPIERARKRVKHSPRSGGLGGCLETICAANCWFAVRLVGRIADYKSAVRCGCGRLRIADPRYDAVAEDCGLQIRATMGLWKIADYKSALLLSEDEEDSETAGAAAFGAVGEEEIGPAGGAQAGHLDLFYTGRGQATGVGQGKVKEALVIPAG
jgi:hypothetical protein